jgi:hypothetical protein
MVGKGEMLKKREVWERGGDWRRRLERDWEGVIWEKGDGLGVGEKIGKRERGGRWVVFL